MTKSSSVTADLVRYCDAGLARLAVLAYASAKPVSGADISARLGKRGYQISPGTLYPMLRRLAEDNLLVVSGQEGRRVLYKVTAGGKQQLKAGRKRLQAMMKELV